MQQETEDSCLSHDGCMWDSEQAYCQSHAYIDCVAAAVNFSAVGTEADGSNSTDPDPGCGTIGEYAKAVYMCEQLSTKGQCSSNRKCKWNTEERPCVVDDEFFVDLVFGDMENDLKSSVLQAGVSCRQQADKGSCAAVKTAVDERLEAGTAQTGAGGGGTRAAALRSPRVWIFT